MFDPNEGIQETILGGAALHDECRSNGPIPSGTPTVRRVELRIGGAATIAGRSLNTGALRRQHDAPSHAAVSSSLIR